MQGGGIFSARRDWGLDDRKLSFAAGSSSLCIVIHIVYESEKPGSMSSCREAEERPPFTARRRAKLARNKVV